MGVQVYWVLFFIPDNQEIQHGSPGVLGFIFYTGQPRVPPAALPPLAVACCRQLLLSLLLLCRPSPSLCRLVVVSPVALVLTPPPRDLLIPKVGGIWSPIILCWILFEGADAESWQDLEPHNFMLDSF